MKSFETFESWDFEIVWNIVEGMLSYLQWQSELEAESQFQD